MTAGSYEGAEWLPARKREWKMDQCIKKRLIAMSLSIVMCFGLCGTGLASDSAVAQEVQGRAVQLRNPVITADNSMKAKQKVTWDCVWFGSYPQAEVVPSSEDYASVKEDMRTEKEVIEESDETVRTEQTFGLLEKTNCPAVLVEQCFVTSPSDVDGWGDEDGCRRAARLYYEAICEYFGTEPLAA